MAGKGAEPKPLDQVSAQQAKKAKSRIRVVTHEPVDAPDLPSHMPDGTPVPERTVEWWDVWSVSPLTSDYRAEDWQDLLDCAVIHARLWTGDYKAASELRLRMARHGATREDRARLRIQFATADEAERKAQRGRAQSEKSARERRSGMHAAETA